MYWYIDGFFDIKPHKDAIYIPEEEYFALMEDIGNGGTLKQRDNGTLYVEKGDKYKENILRNLRLKRENVCFSVINRGTLWYETLTQEQKEELKIWYKAWLDVTDTNIIPDTPSWL